MGELKTNEMGIAEIGPAKSAWITDPEPSYHGTKFVEALKPLGNLAYILGRKITWNPKSEQFADDPQATAMMQRPSRAPWSLS